MYEQGVQNLRMPGYQNSFRVGLNGSFGFTPLVFPLLISGWESFINTVFLSLQTRLEYHHKDFWLIEDEAERWSIEQKTIMYPFMIIGKTFDKGRNPYQDFYHILKLRNCVVHPTNKNVPINTLKLLGQRKILLPREKDIIEGWPSPIMSLECLRWGHNTIIDMMIMIDKMLPTGRWNGYSSLPKKLQILMQKKYS
jgi:hypothetical protein